MNEGRHFLVCYHYSNPGLHPSQVQGINALGFKERILYIDDGKLTTNVLVQWSRLLLNYYTKQHSDSPKIVLVSITRLDN